MKLFGFLRRRSTSVPDRRARCGRWHPGDIAACVDARWHETVAGAPKVGDVLRVQGVEDAIGDLRVRSIFLIFEQHDFGWEARAFRKVVSADAEFTAQIRDLAQRGSEPAPAPHPSDVPAAVTAGASITLPSSDTRSRHQEARGAPGTGDPKP